jgi:hypothetical protein
MNLGLKKMWRAQASPLSAAMGHFIWSAALRFAPGACVTDCLDTAEIISGGPRTGVWAAIAETGISH